MPCRAVPVGLVLGYVPNRVGTAAMKTSGKPLGLVPIRSRSGNASEDLLAPSIVRVVPAMIPAPAEMIAIGDTWIINEPHPSLAGTQVNTVGFLVGTLHNGGANVVFIDGHVEYGKQRKWVETTESARRRWNNDYEPHPATWRDLPE